MLMKYDFLRTLKKSKENIFFSITILIHKGLIHVNITYLKLLMIHVIKNADFLIRKKCRLYSRDFFCAE